MKPYQLSLQAFFKRYGVDLKHGLSAASVEKKQEKEGLNTITEEPPDSLLIVFLRQFQSPLIYVLLIAATIIFFIGERLDAFIISGVLLFNAIVGTVQEGKTHSIVASLKRLIKTNCIVLRDGKRRIIEDTYVVPGDVVVLQAGDRVPADIRIVESHDLAIDESILTGESSVVAKDAHAIHGDNLALHEQKNMVFKGTFVSDGLATGVVTAIGDQTEIGKVHAQLEDIKTEVPLKKQIDRLSRWLLVSIFGMCTFLIGVGLITGKGLQELLVTMVALFICLVPEGLPVVLTIVLVTGAYRLARKQVLIKRLQAVEGLGSVDIVVVDKTGTLTRNEMMVSRVRADGKEWQISGAGYNSDGIIADATGSTVEVSHTTHLYRLACAARLLDRSQVMYVPEHKLYEVKGDPTDAALGVFAHKVGITDTVLSGYKQLHEIPFSSSYQYHAGFYEHEGAVVAFVVGAPEVVFERCAGDVSEQKTLMHAWLENGYRVIAGAYRTVSLTEYESVVLRDHKQWIEKNVTLLGLCALEDAIRSDIKAVVEDARAARINVLMATGDHQRTATFVASRTGIFREGDKACGGKKLPQWLEQLDKQSALETTVFYRVTPHDKLDLVRALQREGYKVAMTGDGVNDAPSLVAADVGVAMGRIGTGVAKQAADILLLDDSFKWIMQAVYEGRHIFHTLRRVMLYFFATNLGEVVVLFLAIMANMPIPLKAAQILWLNLVTDGFLDVSLAMEPHHINRHSAGYRRRTSISLIDMRLLLKVLYFALPMAIGSFAVFYHTSEHIAYARTMALVTMAMFQWFNAWNCRSETLPLYTIGLFTNKWLLLSTSFVLVLQVAVVYVPFMQYIFRTVPLALIDWVIITAISSSVLIIEETRKVLMHRNA